MKSTGSALLSTRLHQGSSRVKAAWWPVIQTALAGALAFWLAGKLLGHATPFFAPVVTWVALGYSFDRSLRKVIELGIGVSVGVGLGEFLVNQIGTGAWQIGVVIALAALVARFIDGASLLVSQAGVQGIVIVGLPFLEGGGALGRWTDALVGAAVAIIVAALTPNDPRLHSRKVARDSLNTFAESLIRVAKSLRTGTEIDRRGALLMARSTESAIADWAASVKTALEATSLKASGRKYRPELMRLQQQQVLTDRAIRSVRVIARRTLSLPEGAHVVELAELLDELARVVKQLAADVNNGNVSLTGQHLIGQLAARAIPALEGEDTEQNWQVQSLILVLRSAIVDIAEACGISPQESRNIFRPL